MLPKVEPVPAARSLCRPHSHNPRSRGLRRPIWMSARSLLYSSWLTEASCLCKHLNALTLLWSGIALTSQAMRSAGVPLQVSDLFVLSQLVLCASFVGHTQYNFARILVGLHHSMRGGSLSQRKYRVDHDTVIAG